MYVTLTCHEWLLADVFEDGLRFPLLSLEQQFLALLSALNLLDLRVVLFWFEKGRYTGGKESHSAWADLPLRSPIRSTDNLAGDNIHRYPGLLFIAFVIYKRRASFRLGGDSVNEIFTTTDRECTVSRRFGFGRTFTSRSTFLDLWLTPCCNHTSEICKPRAIPASEIWSNSNRAMIPFVSSDIARHYGPSTNWHPHSRHL